ncbi:ABC transporter ATP-binding protein [Ligilactobacillus pabuli]|uniref:ABC transporter ATP-binding protein n=1 Tax=Ligilactobacillus pabuli TaxID=2886039 RepID=UPI001F983544|nr:ABC transporter ATP-binding protein [Ligilactobacillus pabuli]HIW89531.1 ABC transporter ATP-binding protein [Candidatus Ligilactobacillus excrementipullorum]
MYLETKGLTKNFGQQTAVASLDLKIEEGSFTAILGPNGAGKSTTIAMLLGLLRPSSGTITYQNSKPRIGVVFQNSVLDAELSVKENLQVRQKMTGTKDQAEILTVMKRLGVSEFAKKRYGRLSGGQRRRVDIARALLGQPEILFLDEPTAGLDIQTRQAIWQVLGELRQQDNLTIVLTTHYLEEADQSEMIFIIDQGQLIAHGSATSLKQRYAKNQLVLEGTDSETLKRLIPEELEPVVITDQQLLVNPVSTQQAIQCLLAVQSELQHFEYREGTLDDAFIALTGKEMH